MFVENGKDCLVMSQSIPNGYIPPGNPGDSLKKIARGSRFDF